MKLFLGVLSLCSALAQAEDSIEYRLPAARVELSFGQVEKAEVVEKASKIKTQGGYWPAPPHQVVQVKQPVRVVLMSDNGESEMVISRTLVGESQLPYSSYRLNQAPPKNETAARQDLQAKVSAFKESLTDPRAKVSVVVTPTAIAISEAKLPK